MELTYGILFDCSEECKNYLRSQLELARECYNYVSSEIFRNNLEYNSVLVHRHTYHPARSLFPGLKSDFVVQIIRTVVSNYRTAKKNRHKIDRAFVCKSPSIQLTRQSYSRLTGTGIALPCGQGRREECRFRLYPKFEEMARRHPMTAPKLGIRNGELFLSVPFKMEGKAPDASGLCPDALGIDLGLRRIATTSDGVAFSDRTYLKARRKVRHLKRRLQQVKSRTAKKHLKRLSRKERNQSKDFCHRLANRLLETDKPVLVLEDLKGIKQRTSRKKIQSKTGESIEINRTRHNSRMSQVPFFEFLRILSYKAPLAGKRVETVSPEYTSQTDCLTGQRVGKRRGCRFVSSTYVLDADWNAALNIRNRHLGHPRSTDVLPYDGRLSVLRGRVHSTTRTDRAMQFA